MSRAVAMVRNLTRSTVVARDVEIAETFLARLRGLLGRATIEETEGLWIEPCSGIHTLGMRFPIEVILLDHRWVVLWAGLVRPWRIGPVHPDAVVALELAPGALERSETALGDRLALERQGPGHDAGRT